MSIHFGIHGAQRANMHGSAAPGKLQNRKGPEIRFLWLAGAVCLATFWQCLTFPFVQDDWTLIRIFQVHDPVALIALFFDPAEKLFYRPLGQACLLLLYKLFGEWPMPFHLLLLCLHTVNACMVHRILSEIVDSRAIAFLSGLIYVAAVAIHLDPLCWAVGIYDVGGAFFFFASICLFLSGRSLGSALLFLLGTLFKESIVTLPAILAAIEITRVSKWNRAIGQDLIRRLLPHCAVLAVLLAVKIGAGESPLALPASHPYAFSFFGPHLFANAFRYCGWMLQAFLPFGNIHGSLFGWVLGGLAVICALVLIFKHSGQTLRRMAGLGLWIVFALLPVVFLPNHSYRYYATYALPAFIGLALVLGKQILDLIGVQRRRGLILGIGATLLILTAIVQSHAIFRQGLHQATLHDGTNGLVRRAKFVEVVRCALLHQLPPPVDQAAIFFSGVDVWSFAKDVGVQTWYRNDAVRVFDLTDLRWSGRGFCIQQPVDRPTRADAGVQKVRIDLDPARVFAFRFSEKDLKLDAIGMSELETIARAQSRTFATADPVG